jgi:hypothetical protein
LRGGLYLLTDSLLLLKHLLVPRRLLLKHLLVSGRLRKCSCLTRSSFC